MDETRIDRRAISIAAGKGGTGKTLLSTSLAQALALAGRPVQVLDCDVEEPNADLLLRPEISETEAVHILVPAVDEDRCTRCGACAEACQFGAIAVIREAVLTFPNLCAACGACSYVCPAGAIEEVEREVGVVEAGSVGGGIDFVAGRLRVGELRSGPVTRAVKARVKPDRIAIIDAPPGTACPMQETVEASDFCILVTEPTPFGLSDLGAAVDTCRALDVPCGVVLNRDGVGEAPVADFCRDAGVPLLLRIPHDRAIAEAYSRGETLVDARPEWAGRLTELYDTISSRLDGHGKELRAHAGT